MVKFELTRSVSLSKIKQAQYPTTSFLFRKSSHSPHLTKQLCASLFSLLYGSQFELQMSMKTISSLKASTN